MTQFHETRMGQILITHTFPELVRQLDRLNRNLERLADLQVGSHQEPQPEEHDDDEDVHETKR